MKPSLSTTGAFTLLEVMIALTILVMGMFAVFSSMGTSVNVSKAVSEHETVTQALENRMEQMQAALWANLAKEYLTSASVAAPTGCRDIGLSPVTSIEPLVGNDHIITTRLARWDEDNQTFNPIAFDQTYSDSQSSGSDYEYWYQDLVTDDRIRGPAAFDIILVTLRADWNSSVGNQTASMEFILVDRDDQDDN
jgi:Tfp pilus assembly protein PilV